ncbi:MAG: alpha/beta hydrolase [Clostridia bacterium]|nr:alpha/beta hydrolase [Clostridia bacterium]
MGWIITGSILIFLIAVVFTVSYVTYRIAFYSPKKKRKGDYDFPSGAEFSKHKESLIKLIDKLNALEFEEVKIRAFDGVILRARYYHILDGAPVQIQFHGYKGTAARDFCGGNLLARQCGHNTLLVDQRGAGESGGNTICFGAKEKYDCLAWCNYVYERFGTSTPIYLAGVSMGASTVLGATGLSLPPTVKGVVADCPFSSPKQIIKKVCKQMGFSPALAYPFLAFGAFVFGGFRLKDGELKDAVKGSRVPILLIHGDEDGLVPFEMSEEIYKTNEEMVQLEVFEGAGHGMSYIVDPDRYERVIKEFLSR